MCSGQQFHHLLLNNTATHWRLELEEMKSSPKCVCMHKSRAFITLHRLSREENEIKGEVRVDPSQESTGYICPYCQTVIQHDREFTAFICVCTPNTRGFTLLNCFCGGEGVVAVNKTLNLRYL